MVAHNPSYPAVAGNEWMPSVPRSFPIAKGQQSPVARVRSLAAENINAARLEVASNPAVTDRAFLLWDIYAEGNEAPQTLSVVEYPPILDETIGNWTTNAGGVTNLFARIDDAVVYPPSGTDYIRQIVGGASAYRCSVDSSGFSGTARVLRVSVAAVIGLVSLPGTAIVEIGLYHEPSATPYTPPGGFIYTNGLIPNAVQYVDCGEINPVTNLPWTPADIQSFDSGDWHLRFVGAGTGSNGPIITAAALRVSYLTTENRAAVATWRRPAGAVSSPITTDALVPMPAGTGAWAAANATNYLWVPRIARDRLVGGSAPVANDIAWLAAQQDLGASGNPPGLASAPYAGPAAMALRTTDEHGQLTAAFTADLVAVPRIVLRTTAPADSASSYPYKRDSSSVVIRSLTAAQQVGQRITPTTGPRNYLGVRTLVRPPDSIDGTLTIRVLRVSDSTQMGGTLTFTADQVRALPEIVGSGGFRYLEGFLSSAAALANATQYEVQLLVSAGTWQVIMPSAVGAGGQSYNGTTDFARLGTIAGGSSLTEQELVVMLLEQPSAPATATAQVRDEPTDGVARFCAVSSVDQVEVKWAATALTTSWARYEIERETDAGTEAGFVPVWQITSAEATTSWWDREMDMDRRSRYRIRVVSTASAFSDWTYTDWVEPSSRGNEVVFTSNHRPDLTVVYNREPTAEIGFLDYQSDELVPIYGAPYQVEFQDPEEHGETEQYVLTINFAAVPSDNLGRRLNLRQVFAPLKAMTRATDRPYVCVRHRDGETMFGKVVLSQGRVSQPGQQYVCTVLGTPTTATPIVGTS